MFFKQQLVIYLGIVVKHKFITILAPLCNIAPPQQSVTRKGNYFGAQRGQTGDGMV
jgi:hypothetical protein